MELTREDLIRSSEAWAKACQLAARDATAAHHEAWLLREALREIAVLGYGPASAIVDAALDKVSAYKEQPPLVECGDQ